MEELIKRFDTVWESFTTSFGGTLIADSKGGGITFQDAKLALSTCLDMWRDRADICGHWLNKLCLIDPEKGDKVKDVIEDIELKPIDKKLVSGSLSGTAAGAAAAAIGYAASKAFELGTTATVASTVGPAVVAFPVVSSVIKKSNAKKVEETIKGYESQLEQYKRLVLSILE